MTAQESEGLNLSIEKVEAEFLSNLALLDDALLQYEYVLNFIDELAELPERECVDECKVAGCASNAWMKLSCDNGRLVLRFNADALIIKGLLGVLTWLLDGRLLAEVASWEPQLFNDQNLKPLLNTDRRHGIVSIVASIRASCEE